MISAYLVKIVAQVVVIYINAKVERKFVTAYLVDNQDTLREFSVIQLPSSSLGRELPFLCKNFVNHFYKIIPYLSICVFAGKSLDSLEIL